MEHAEVLNEARRIATTLVPLINDPGTSTEPYRRKVQQTIRTLVDIIERQDEKIAEFIDGEAEGETDDATR